METLQYGNGVPVVVRRWESHLHGEAGQFILDTVIRKVREALRNPVNVLKTLYEKASNSNYCFERLYRNLYNPNFYLLAYANIYDNKGSMTKGIDFETLSEMGLDRINKIISKLKDHSYKPNPVR